MPAADRTIHPFRVEVPEAVLDDLRVRLQHARFPDQLEGAGWDYGTDLAYLTELVAYWHDAYDWRRHERRINQFPQFRTVVDGTAIHFLHVRSPEPDALPLLVSHGWPGSIVEFLDVLEPLADPRAHGADPRDAFHLVVPSLPGFAFSGPTNGRGWHPGRIAAAFAELMARLGYARFGAQGGDWGSLITRLLATGFPDRVVGVHVNNGIGVVPPRDADPASFTESEREAIARREAFRRDGSGYLEVQASRPQTIGYALDDSPAGLAAWILDKFRAWSDCDGDLERAFGRDQLLTNIMCYWVTCTGHSSARIYYENRRALREGLIDLTARIEVPTAVAVFPKDNVPAQRRWAEHECNLVHFSEHPRGGHFAAMEQPALFVEDVRAAFRLMR